MDRVIFKDWDTDRIRGMEKDIAMVKNRGMDGMTD